MTYTQRIERVREREREKKERERGRERERKRETHHDIGKNLFNIYNEYQSIIFYSRIYHSTFFCLVFINDTFKFYYYPFLRFD